MMEKETWRDMVFIKDYFGNPVGVLVQTEWEKHADGWKRVGKTETLVGATPNDA